MKLAKNKNKVLKELNWAETAEAKRHFLFASKNVSLNKWNDLKGFLSPVFIFFTKFSSSLIVLFFLPRRCNRKSFQLSINVPVLLALPCFSSSSFCCPDEKAKISMPHFSWINVRFFPSFFFLSLFFFFSASWCLSVVDEVNEVSYSGGVMWGRGRSEMSPWAGMTRFVRWMCVFLSRGIRCNSSPERDPTSSTFFSWVLLITHSSQLLFSPCSPTLWALLQILDGCHKSIPQTFSARDILK